MAEHSDTTSPRGARALVLAASAAALVPWLFLCLLMLGFSGMCTDDHDRSDCSTAVELPILLGVTGLALAIVQAVFAVRGTSTSLGPAAGSASARRGSDRGAAARGCQPRLSTRPVSVGGR